MKLVTQTEPQMTTPTIEIEATGSLEATLEDAIAELMQAMVPLDDDSPTIQDLKILLAQVKRARCLQRHNDERQIRLQLPPL